MMGLQELLSSFPSLSVFLTSYLHICTTYYGSAFLIHNVGLQMCKMPLLQVNARTGWEPVRDALYSLGPIGVKAGVWTLVRWFRQRGLGLLYDRPIDSLSHVLYCLACIVTLDYLHDSWFYWTHRLLHWRPLYKHVHYIHHKSRAPTAYTGYSFHLIEAAIVFANEVIVCFLFPIHAGLHWWYHTFTTIIHVGGHAGYEIAPLIPSVEQLFVALMYGRPTKTKALNTVQHHDFHHRFPLRHFSLYFTHWDRWCGTLHPKYDETAGLEGAGSGGSGAKAAHEGRGGHVAAGGSPSASTAAAAARGGAGEEEGHVATAGAPQRAAEAPGKGSGSERRLRREVAAAAAVPVTASPGPVTRARARAGPGGAGPVAQEGPADGPDGGTAAAAGAGMTTSGRSRGVRARS